MYKKCTIAVAALLTAGILHAQVKINAGGVLTNAGAVVVLHDMDLVNDGSVDYTTGSAGRFVFAGDLDNIIGGSGTTKFTGLEINKTAGKKMRLQTNASAAGDLSFTSGMLDLGNNNFELVNPGGMLMNETENNRVMATGTGEIFKVQDMTGMAGLNMGNLGAVISNANNLGVTAIRRGHVVQTDPMGHKSIARYYSIQPTNNTALNATLTLQYFDAELNGLPEAGLIMQRREGSNPWQVIGRDGSDMTLNTVTKNNIASFSTWTLTDINNPLPLTLLAFSATCKSNVVNLQWITTNEAGVKNFVVEQSSNGNNWQEATTIAANNNGTSQHTYHAQIPASSNSLVRLKMNDVNGSVTYSAVKTINCTGAELITASPNPTAGIINFTLQLNNAVIIRLTITDATGRLLQEKDIKAPAGLSVQQLSLSEKPAGTYMIRMTSKNGLDQTIKLLKL